MKEVKTKKRRALKHSWSRVIIDYLGGVCLYCGSSDMLNIHHIIPLSKGGVHKMSNLELVCRKCHHEIHKFIDLVLPRKKSTQYLIVCDSCNFQELYSKKPKYNLCYFCTRKIDKRRGNMYYKSPKIIRAISKF